MQRLSFELEGYKSIMNTIIGNSNFLYTKEMYDYHIEKFKEINKEYRVAINELLVEYGGDLPNQDSLDVKIYFNINTVHILDRSTGDDIVCCKK